MLGILFIAYARVAAGSPADLQLDVLLSQGALLEDNWIRAGFVFFSVGFATKMGLAPVHMWKPDAYGEAPGLVGALMAGGLTIVAFLAMLRGVQVMDAAGDGVLAHNILLGFGLLSVVVAAISMVNQPDIKRLLSYSSIEHVGILAIGIGVGGLATFGALLHLISNSLSKGSMFLTAGNLHRSFGSKRLPEISGAISALPVSGRIFMGGFIAIAGTPPFGLFISEWLILSGMFQQGYHAAAVVLLIALGISFAGLSQTMMRGCMGEKPATPIQHRDRLLLVAPPLAMLLIVLALGIHIPAPLHDLLTGATALIEVKP
jgi:hydrogenase-4 component F